MMHPQWKGDDVSYRTLHYWVTKHLPKPQVCQICKLDKRLEVSNKNGLYIKNLDNWQWVCINCHRRYDSDKRLKDRKCYICGGSKKPWRHLDGQFTCSKCYMKEWEIRHPGRKLMI